MIRREKEKKVFMIKVKALKTLIRASKRHKAIDEKIITKIHSQKQCLIYVGGKINKSKS
jgi:hypothetical protein